MSRSKETEKKIDLNELMVELALQKHFTKATTICWDMCIHQTPGNKISNYERNCLAHCSSRYADTVSMFNQTVAQRIKEGKTIWPR
jgi:hypothetical protein